MIDMTDIIHIIDMILTLCLSVALLPIFLYAVLHAQSYTKQLLNVSYCTLCRQEMFHNKKCCFLETGFIGQLYVE